MVKPAAVVMRLAEAELPAPVQRAVGMASVAPMLVRPAQATGVLRVCAELGAVLGSLS